MPGIVGLITKQPRQVAERQLRLMLGAIHHEPFYVAGISIDEPLGVYVAWTALEGSFSSQMPIEDQREAVSLVFSGEEFSRATRPQSTRSEGVGGADDNSFLAYQYVADREFPKSLNGRFHGLVVDRKRRMCTLFNDRYGMHRVYYHEGKDAFYFAAEAKAILAVRPELRQLDPRALGEFVACGCVLEGRSLFPGIHVLPGAAAWRFRAGALDRKDTYFCPSEWESQEPLDDGSYYCQLRDVFSRRLPHYFAGHGRIGMSLTGGLDTRTVLAWQPLAPESLPCYTYGGLMRESRDVVISRKVASACGQPHKVITAGQDFLARFSHYAERSVYLSDACTDLWRSPDLYLSERARLIAPIRMTGLYGDEVFRCARSFKPKEPRPGLFRPEFLSYVRQAQLTYDDLVQRLHPLSFSVFCQAPWFHRGILSLEETQLTVRTPFLDNDVVRTVFRAPQSAISSNDVRVRLIQDGNPRLRSIRTDLGFCGRKGRLAAAVAQAWQKFTFKAEYAYDYGMPQNLVTIDHLLAPLHLEKLFLGRHKLLHFRVWYRDILSSYVRDMLLDPVTLSRPYVQPHNVQALVKGHLDGTHNFTTEIHRLLTLELVHRLFTKSIPSSESLLEVPVAIH